MRFHNSSSLKFSRFPEDQRLLVRLCVCVCVKWRRWFYNYCMCDVKLVSTWVRLRQRQVCNHECELQITLIHIYCQWGWGWESSIKRAKAHQTTRIRIVIKSFFLKRKGAVLRTVWELVQGRVRGLSSVSSSAMCAFVHSRACTCRSGAISLFWADTPPEKPQSACNIAELKTLATVWTCVGLMSQQKQRLESLPEGGMRRSTGGRI